MRASALEFIVGGPASCCIENDKMYIYSSDKKIGINLFFFYYLRILNEQFEKHTCKVHYMILCPVFRQTMHIIPTVICMMMMINFSSTK